MSETGLLISGKAEVITNTIYYGFLAAGALFIWLKGKRESESGLLLKVLAYSFLAAFTFRLNGFPLPLGCVIAYLLMKRAAANRIAKRYAVYFGLLLMVLGLLPLREQIELALYPRAEMATYMHLTIDPKTDGFSIILINSKGQYFHNLSENSEEGIQLYEALAHSTKTEVWRGERQYDIQIGQDTDDGRFRQLLFEVNGDGSRVALKQPNRTYYFDTTPAFRQLFKSVLTETR